MAPDEPVNNVNNANKDNEDTPTAYEASDKQVSSFRVNETNVTNVTESRAPLSRTVATRIPEEINLYLESMAQRHRVTVSIYLRWLIEDAVRLDRLKPKLPPNTPTIIVHTVEAQQGDKNAREQAFDSMRVRLYEKLGRIRRYVQENRPQGFIKQKAKELTGDFDSYHKVVRNLEPGLLEEDAKVLEELKKYGGSKDVC